MVKISVPLLQLKKEGRSTFIILTGEPTGERSLGRDRCNGRIIIRMDLKEIGVNTRYWVDLAENRDYRRVVVKAALNSRFYKSWS